MSAGQTIPIFYSKRSDTSTWSAGTDADGATPFSGDTGTASTYADATNPGGASANETLTFRANYHKIGETITPGTANATGTITLQYN